MVPFVGYLKEYFIYNNNNSNMEMQFSWEQFEEMCRPVGLTAKQELKAYNIKREYEAISNFTEKTKFDLGKCSL